MTPLFLVNYSLSDEIVCKLLKNVYSDTMIQKYLKGKQCLEQIISMINNLDAFVWGADDRAASWNKSDYGCIMLVLHYGVARGLVLVTSIMKNPSIDIGNVTNGGVLTTLAFDQIPYIGPMILVFGIILFAYSTVLGWAYYGERCVEYCFGKNALIPYRVLYVLVAAIAPVVALDLVWTIADILNALMAIPNLIAILLLTPVIVKETKKYINNLDARSDEQVPVVDRKENRK